MHEEVIATMRGRVKQLRKIIALAHDPRMIEALETVVGTTETHIEKLESDRDRASSEIPTPQQTR